MSFTPNKNLQPDPKILLHDYQHAARLFTDDQFRLAPKHKFLFHVAFGINTGVLSNTALVQRHGQEINMLVKAVDLPHYQVSTEMLNQYNRKKVVQYQHKPQDINIKFHDDNMGLINQLWQNYYSYYYADSISAKTNGAYSRNATRSSDFILTPYGLDNGSSVPFFNYIKIYQMARHEYVMYQLWNPVITSWNHNKLSYSENNVNDFDMKIAYEAVSYDVGTVEAGDPEGFGLTHYDTTPSSLNGNATFSGSTSPSFANSVNAAALGPSILNAAINQVTNAQRTQSSTTTPLSGVLQGTPIQTVSGVSGSAGVNFPVSSASTNTTTVAVASVIGT
jgi:hypothetical protein